MEKFIDKFKIKPDPLYPNETGLDRASREWKAGQDELDKITKENDEVDSQKDKQVNNKINSIPNRYKEYR